MTLDYQLQFVGGLYQYVPKIDQYSHIRRPHQFVKFVALDRAIQASFKTANEIQKFLRSFVLVFARKKRL
jgi:hypothetical protein